MRSLQQRPWLGAPPRGAVLSPGELLASGTAVSGSRGRAHILLVSLLLAPVAASGAWGGSRDAALSFGMAVEDSGLSVAVVCADFRSGAESRYQAVRVTATGTLDTTGLSAAVLCAAGIHSPGIRPAFADGEDAILAWVDERNGDGDIYAARLLANGELAGDWPSGGLPVCAAPLSQYDLDIAPDGVGGAFLAWVDYRARRAGRVYLQHIDSSGEPTAGWPTGGLELTGTAGVQASPKLVPDGGGGVFALWLDRRSGTLGLYGQHFGSGGPTRLWEEDGKAIVAGERTPSAIAATRDGGGGFLLVWRDGSGPGSSLRGLRLAGAGTPSSGWGPDGMAISAPAQLVGEPVIVGTEAGGAIVAWAEEGEGRRGVVAVLVTADGQVARGWPTRGLSITGAGTSTGAPVLRHLGSGDFLLVWEHRRGGGDCDIYAQRVTSSGEVAPGWPAGGLAVRASPGDQYSPSVVLDGSGGAVVTWLDEQVDRQAYLARAGSVAGSTLRLIEVKALPTLVRLAWQLPRDRALTVRAYRRHLGEPWGVVGTPSARDGRLVLEDRSVQPGDRLEYRLSIRGRNVEAFLEPVAVNVPLAPLELAMTGPRLSLARRAILATIALPNADAAKLELFDLAGRRVTSHDLTPLGVGVHEVELALPPGLARGIFFLRLTQGRQVRKAKLVYLR